MNNPGGGYVYRGDGDIRLDATELCRREVYLRCTHADMKESFKQLFTLISAALFSAAVLQSITPGPAGTPRERDIWDYVRIGSYVVIGSSLLVCTVGYYLTVTAADKATNLNLWGHWWLNNWSYGEVALAASWWFDAAGGLFFLGVLAFAFGTLAK